MIHLISHRSLWNASLLAALSCAIRCEELGRFQDSREATQLVEQLRSPELHRAALRELKARPPAEVVPAMIGAIQSDPAFKTTAWLRASAYEVLTEIGREPGPRGRFRDRDQIVQLLTGLTDSDAGIQSMCLHVVPWVDEAFLEEVGNRVVPLLDSEDLLLVGAAAQSLGDVGVPATPSLPRLLEVLRGTAEADRAKWVAARAQFPERRGEDDLEVVTRASAAYARIEIAGPAIDLDAYPHLDERGQWAAIIALRRPLILALKGDNQAGHGFDDLQLSKITEFSGAVTNSKSFLPAMRLQGVGVLGWMASAARVPAGIRDSAVAYLEAAQADEDAKVSALAQTLLSQIKH